MVWLPTIHHTYITSCGIDKELSKMEENLVHCEVGSLVDYEQL